MCAAVRTFKTMRISPETRHTNAQQSNPTTSAHLFGANATKTKTKKKVERLAAAHCWRQSVAASTSRFSSTCLIDSDPYALPEIEGLLTAGIAPAALKVLDLREKLVATAVSGSPGASSLSIKPGWPSGSF
jgi:hypothetical protein